MGSNFSHAEHESRRLAKMEKLRKKLIEKKRKAEEEAEEEGAVETNELGGHLNEITESYKRTKFSHDTDEKVEEKRNELSTVNQVSDASRCHEDAPPKDAPMKMP